MSAADQVWRASLWAISIADLRRSAQAGSDGDVFGQVGAWLSAANP